MIIENKFKNVKGSNKKLSFKIEHTYDKKETIKQRDIDREMKKSLKERF